MTVTIYDPTGSVTLIHSAPPTGATGSTGATGTSGVSPDGTKCPPAASIVDSSLVVWSLGVLSAAGQAVLKNGTQWAGGSVALLEWSGGKMYGQNNAANGSTWVLITATGYASTTNPNPTGATGPTGSTGSTGSTGLPTTGVLTAKLDFGGGSVANFTMATATDNGAWHGEFTNQHWYTAHDPLFPDWRVQMRFDTDVAGNRLTGVGVRDEFVVELGGREAAVPADWTTPYTATFKKDGVVLYTGTAPRHRTAGRWRWPFADRPVVRTPAVLKQRNLILNYGQSGLFGLLPWAATCTIPVPMGSVTEDVSQGYGNNAFYQNNMGVAGDHTQIGFVTEATADYMIRGGEPARITLMTEGEWFGRAPFHHRDDATGDMLDMQTGYKGFVNSGGTIPDTPASADPTDIVLDSAHMYPLALGAWLLTDDPYYAEELGFSINWSLSYWRNRRQSANLPGLAPFYQGRDFTWTMRDIFIAAATIPAVTPIGLRNKAYWEACVADNTTLAMEYVNSKSVSCTVFRTWPRTETNAGWMACWLSTIAVQAAQLGFAQWDVIAAWSIEQQLALTRAGSRWRSWFSPYYFACDKNWVNRVATGSLWLPDWDATITNATMCASWDGVDSLFDYYMSGSPSGTPVQLGTDEHGNITYPLVPPVADGKTMIEQIYVFGGYPASGTAPAYVGGTIIGYVQYMHACLAAATALPNLPEALLNYTYVHSQMPAILAYPFPNAGLGSPQARYSIDPVAPSTGNTIELVGSNVMADNDPDPTRTSVYRGVDGFPGILAYSGMAIAPNLGAQGSLMIVGGGDGDRFGNDVHRYDKATAVWSRFSEPSTALSGLGFSVDPAYDAVHSEYGDGTVGMSHTFNHSAVVEGGTNNQGLLILTCNVWTYGHNMSGWAHSMDLGAPAPRKWQRYSTNAVPNIQTPQATCYDAANKRIWVLATSGWASQICYLDLDPTTATFKSYVTVGMASGNAVNIGDAACSCQFPVNGFMIIAAWNGGYQAPQTFQLYAIDLSAALTPIPIADQQPGGPTLQMAGPGATQLTLAGFALPHPGGQGGSIDYDPATNALYSYLPQIDLSHVYKMPWQSTNPLTSQWPIEQITLPSAFAADNSSGIYSRWRNTGGKFALVTNVTDQVALWTPPQ